MNRINSMQPVHGEYKLSVVGPASLEQFTMAYVTFGNPFSAKKLVCVHGLSRNSRDFDYLASALAHDYFIICPDMPGRGDSTSLSNPVNYSYIVYCDAILSLCKELKIDKCDYIGTSMGGIIGMILARSNSLIGKMIINDIGPVISIDVLKKIASYVSQDWVFDDISQALDYFKLSMSGFGIKTKEVWNHVIENGVKKNADGKYVLKFDVNAGIEFKNEIEVYNKDLEFWPIWDDISEDVDLFVIRGEKSDVLQSDTVDQMKAKRKFSFIQFPNIGHAPSLMYDDQIHVVKEWLLSK